MNNYFTEYLKYKIKYTESKKILLQSGGELSVDPIYNKMIKILDNFKSNKHTNNTYLSHQDECCALVNIILYVMVYSNKIDDLELAKNIADTLQKDSNIHKLPTNIQTDYEENIMQGFKVYLPKIIDSKFYISPNISDKGEDNRSSGYELVLDIIMILMKLFNSCAKYDITKIIILANIVNNNFKENIIISKCNKSEYVKNIERGVWFKSENIKNKDNNDYIKYSNYVDNNYKIFISSS